MSNPVPRAIALACASEQKPRGTTLVTLNSGAPLADQRARRCYHLKPDMYKRERPGYPMVGEWPLDDEIVALRLLGTDQINELAQIGRAHV